MIRKTQRKGLRIMPNSKKKILTPMWLEGTILRSYENHQATKMVAIEAKRVWVGVDKGLSQSTTLSVGALEDWIFNDLHEGYRKVKSYNNELVGEG